MISLTSSGVFRFCLTCGAKSTVTRVTTRGFAVTIHYECDASEKHSGVWHSSDVVDRRHRVNMVVSSSFSLCGAGHTLLKSIFECLRCPFLKSSGYYQLLKTKLYPIIVMKWELIRNLTIAGLKNRASGIKLSGDGHYDSPGWCAKYCTYSAMDIESHAIVDFFVVQKKMYTGELEKEGCRELLTGLIEKGLDIGTFVTDQNDKIGKMIRTTEKFQSIKHALDVWHMAKNLKKKLVKSAKKHENLKKWVEPVVTHFWYACQKCNGDPSLLLQIFHSCLLHLAGKHAWTKDPFTSLRGSGKKKKPYPVFPSYVKCAHKRKLTGKHRSLRGLQWLDMNSEEYRILYSIITDTRRSNSMKKCADFIHTGDLEVYHNVHLKYLPKRSSYSLVRMIVMAMLVGIEVNTNLQKRGTPKSYKQYSKVRAGWVAKPRFKGKVFQFRHDIIEEMMKFHELKCSFPKIDDLLRESGYIRRYVPKNIAPIEKPSSDSEGVANYSRF